MRLLLALASAVLTLSHAQPRAVLPDTTVLRGEVVIVPISLIADIESTADAKIVITYSRAALSIEKVAGMFPTGQGNVEIILDNLPTTDTGFATLRVTVPQSLSKLEFLLWCRVLWSGISPAALSVRSIEQNGAVLTVVSQGGQLTLVPPEPLQLQRAPSLGPLSPQPLYGELLTVTYWLPEESDVEFVLYDPLGREYQRLRQDARAAGPQTVQLRFDRSSTSAGVYYLRMVTRHDALITPCVIAK
ncbi:MAG: hypothetical protein RML15_03010 [Bacteroidota bacterium]|nr:hypothetical protein [Candidatus Kapabacteria bacterium]MCS7303050.1 hypothetical protein [Candidatus Kapabacteria bacterium]MCX7937636.1 hypothetical protein [Chlorobiota bacterium]MDW8074158.1 hypothetical protein [Bacteroidota bacterium]MDW8271366.1 hypothetical protein [Bacteroidota bacterium]